MIIKPLITSWTLDEGRCEIQRVQSGSRAYGYHVALGGGVLNTGSSRKDLDLYFLPLDNDTSKPNSGSLVQWLETLWGKSEPINDPNYGPSDYYTQKLKFMPLVSKRIDVFVIGG